MTSVLTQSVPCSGDATGVSDSRNIKAVLDSQNAVVLGCGTYHLAEPVRLGRDGAALFGHGFATSLAPIGTFAAIECVDAQRITIADVRTTGGLHGIDLNHARRVNIRGVCIDYPESHGIICHKGVWIVSVSGGWITGTGGDGIHVDGATDGDGNAFTLHGVTLEDGKGHAIRWSGVSLDVSGCCIEGWDQSAIHIAAVQADAKVVSVRGCYFETNKVAHIELERVSGKGVIGVNVSSNSFQNDECPTCLLVSGPSGEFRRVVFDATNWTTGSETKITGLEKLASATILT